MTHLALGGFGVLTVQDEAVDWESGHTCYRVHGARVAGTFTIRPTPAGDGPIPTHVAVAFGRDDSGRMAEWDDRPTVNGVRLLGTVGVGDPRRVATWSPTSRSICAGEPYATTSLSDATMNRATAVVRALVGRWYARPDLYPIIRAAARHQAPHRLARTHDTIAKLKEQAGELNRQISEQAERAAALSRLATDDLRQHAAATG